MPLTQPQQKIVETPQRFIVVVAGRRFGKTHLAINRLSKYAAQPNQTVWYVAPTYKQAKMITWKKLKNKLTDLRWVKKVNETELTLELKNGSVICLKGADNYDSLRGVGINFLVMDEFADIDPEAWYETLRPTLSDTGGKAMFIGTPKGYNWAKDIYDLAEEFPEEWASFQFTTLDGGQVPLSEVEAARRELDARTFRQEYMATWESFSGRVFYAFDRAKNVKAFDIKDYQSIRMADTLHIGMDFNVSQMSAVVGVREGNYFHIIDEIMIPSSNTDEMVDEIKLRYANKQIVCYPDPSGAARKTSAAGKTDHTILRMAGFSVKSPHQHNPVRDGVNAVNAKLCSSTDEVTLFVDPKCRKTVESLEKLCYKESTNQIDKDSGFDHAADALRYVIDWLFPIRQPVAPLPIQTWGHKVKRWS